MNVVEEEEWRWIYVESRRLQGVALRYISKLTCLGVFKF